MPRDLNPELLSISHYYAHKLLHPQNCYTQRFEPRVIEYISLLRSKTIASTELLYPEI